MVKRKITIKLSAAKRIAEISWYVEFMGMAKTAKKFSDSVYDFIETLSDSRKSYRACVDPIRSKLGLKCVNYNKKYTVAFIETGTEIVVCEFISSKTIWW